MLKYTYNTRRDFMADYIRVFETTSEKKANEYIKKGWDLIDTPTVTNFDGDSHYSSHTQYTLGLSTKEYANKLLAIIREYEKHDLKEILFEKVAEERNDNAKWYEEPENEKHMANIELLGPGLSKSPIAKFMTNYEDVVNEKKISYYKKSKLEIDDEDLPFD